VTNLAHIFESSEEFVKKEVNLLTRNVGLTSIPPIEQRAFLIHESHFDFNKDSFSLLEMELENANDKGVALFWLTHFRGRRAVPVFYFLVHLHEYITALNIPEARIEFNRKELSSPFFVDYTLDAKYITRLLPYV